MQNSKMNEHIWVNEEGITIKKDGYTCPKCNKFYSDLFLRYQSRTIKCDCGEKLDNPMR